MRALKLVFEAGRYCPIGATSFLQIRPIVWIVDEVDEVLGAHAELDVSRPSPRGPPSLRTYLAAKAAMKRGGLYEFAVA